MDVSTYQGMVWLGATGWSLQRTIGTFTCKINNCLILITIFCNMLQSIIIYYPHIYYSHHHSPTFQIPGKWFQLLFSEDTASLLGPGLVFRPWWDSPWACSPNGPLMWTSPSRSIWFWPSSLHHPEGLKLLAGGNSKETNRTWLKMNIANRSIQSAKIQIPLQNFRETGCLSGKYIELFE